MRKKSSRITDRKLYVHALSVVSKSTTLDDVERPYRTIAYCINYASFGTHHKNFKFHLLECMTIRSGAVIIHHLSLFVLHIQSQDVVVIVVVSRRGYAK